MPEIQPLQVGQAEAARILGYSDVFLRKIPDLPVIRVGRSVRYAVSDLIEWQKRHATLPDRSDDAQAD